MYYNISTYSNYSTCMYYNAMPGTLHVHKHKQQRQSKQQGKVLNDH